MTSGNPYSELGTELFALRTRKGWSLRRAAEAIGSIGHNRLRDFERAEDPHSGAPTRPTEEQLHRIAKAYEVHPDRLLMLAGYSAVGPLSEYEQHLVRLVRELSETGRMQLMELAFDYRPDAGEGSRLRPGEPSQQKGPGQSRDPKGG